MYKVQDVLHMNRADFSAVHSQQTEQNPIPCTLLNTMGKVLQTGYIGACSAQAKAALDALPFGCEAMDLIQMDGKLLLCARDKAICAAQYICLS